MATFTATEMAGAKGAVVGKGEAGNLKSVLRKVELTAGATGRTIDFGKIPSNARILPSSKVFNDDCATTGAPTLDFGLSGDLITDDDDALGNSVVTLATASATGYALLSDVNFSGVPAWDLVNGQTSDPGGALTVLATQKDAATTATGTVVLELHYILD